MARPRKDWAESTRKKQREYQQRARLKLAADVDRETGELFRRYCEERGATVSAMIANYVYSIVGRPEDRRRGDDPATWPEETGKNSQK